MATTPDQIARRLAPGELITLFELDLTSLGAPSIFYFHDGVDQGANQIGFRGHTYTPMAIKAEGFEANSRGTLPRPKITVSNIGSVISSLLVQYKDFVGGIVTMRMTFSIYVLRNGVKVNATEYDSQPPWKEFAPQIFTIDRKTSETNTFVTFDLATPMDSEGILLPRRQILATACPFTYRGTECGFPAPSVGGGGWPSMNRKGEFFQSGVFTDGLVSPDGTQLASALAAFRTTPSHLSDVGKLIVGANFLQGTFVSAVVSDDVVNLSVKATPGSPVAFNIVRTTGRKPLSEGGGTTMPLPYDDETVYQQWDTAYVLQRGILIYYVSVSASPHFGQPLTDENFWMADVCLKKLSDCKARFGALNALPYGGFPGANKLT